jgi:signal transduction histidine kinase
VSNAIKFTPPHGKVNITMKLVRYDAEEVGSATGGADYKEMLRVEVEDSGHGISAENQHRVFNEIVQFHANTQQGIVEIQFCIDASVTSALLNA